MNRILLFIQHLRSSSSNRHNVIIFESISRNALHFIVGTEIDNIFTPIVNIKRHQQMQSLHLLFHSGRELQKLENCYPLAIVFALNLLIMLTSEYTFTVVDGDSGNAFKKSTQ